MDVQPPRPAGVPDWKTVLTTPPVPPPTPVVPPLALASIASVVAAEKIEPRLLALDLAEKAYLAYSEPCAIEAELKNATNICHFRVKRSAAFGYTLHNHAWISFRGTASLCDLFCTDLAALPYGSPLQHYGFRRAWRRIQPDISAWLSTLPPDTRGLILTGHSLGGAMALLAGFDLALQFPIRAVVTFGAPRAGLVRFKWMYESRPSAPGSPILLAEVTRRYTHQTDIVSRIVPPLVFWHVGSEHTIKSDGTIHTDRPPGLAERADAALVKIGEHFFGPGYRSVWQVPNAIAGTHEGPARLQAIDAPAAIERLPKPEETLAPPPQPIAAILDKGVDLRTRVEQTIAAQPAARITVPNPLAQNVAPSALSQPPSSHFDRTLGAWQKHFDRVHRNVWWLPGLPVFVVWTAVAVLGLAFALAIIGDVGEHFSRKYIAAFEKNQPKLL